VLQTPKKTKEMEGLGVTAHRAAHPFKDVASLVHATPFLRGAVMRASESLFVLVPGAAPWLFTFGLNGAPRLGDWIARCTTIVTTPPAAKHSLPAAFLSKAKARQELWLFQGPKALLDKHVEGQVPKGKIGVDDGDAGKSEWLSVVGVPKTADWHNQLLGAPYSFITNAGAYKAQAASIALPFGGFKNFESKFNAVGLLARALGGRAVIVGFNARLLLPTAWSEEIFAKAAKLESPAGGGGGSTKVCQRIFLDTPIAAAATDVDAAAAAVPVANSSEIGVVVVADDGATTPELWKELAAWMVAEKLCTSARPVLMTPVAMALAIPAAAASAVVGSEFSSLFVVRSPFVGGARG
jgi:hypothetical protein